jgi:hypothetical protein
MREFALSVLLLVATLSAQAAEPLIKLGIVLLQPSSVLEDRVSSVDAMAEYIKSVEAASREAVLASALRQSAGGFIVIAVRPGQKSKVWLDFDSLLDADIGRQIVSRVTQVRPFDARKGPVVFALKVAVWDGRESGGSRMHSPSTGGSLARMAPGVVAPDRLAVALCGASLRAPTLWRVASRPPAARGRPSQMPGRRPTWRISSRTP